MTRHSDMMVDIETLGTRRGCVVLSIGACLFDRAGEGVGETLHLRLDPRPQVARGFHIDPDTVMWWMRQSQEARMAWAGEQASMEALTPSAALGQLRDFWRGGTLGKAHVWANSPSFDLVNLDALWVAANIECPWSFRDELDMRTMRRLCPDIRVAPPEVAHRADADAVAQALFVQQAWRRLMMSGPAHPQREGERLEDRAGPLAVAGGASVPDKPAQGE